MRPALQTHASRAGEVLRQDLLHLEVRRTIVVGLAHLLPSFVGNRLRTTILRAAGWDIGRGAMFFGAPRTFGSGVAAHDFVIGPLCAISLSCTFELNDRITLGPAVSLGPNVMILTSSHQIGTSGKRAGRLFTAPVIIEQGAWVGANTVVLPGVTIGRGAVVSANSVVNKDVPPNCVVAGSPATVVVKRLPG